jgi:SpoVK/Ycf46/Vps4 family AAA+-type ATPase
LPPMTSLLVREAAAAIRNRGLVYEDWRMAPASGTTGLNMLFSGVSGTGKTMSASIIAAECGLDLFRIDLAGVVSKYIGETEKNLDRIFTAARASNAILFFDEADAIFGKRSEVRDAHDRYANIEVSYLLQKLEEHDGVIILASNLSRNIDEAFSRRIQFHVEFPMPAEPHRERLWRAMFPPEAPLADDVDFAFLARQFQMTGGQIRTVTVDAAFVAAADGRRITMPLIVKAVARHFVKEGRMPTAHEFQIYYPLLTDAH